MTEREYQALTQTMDRQDVMNAWSNIRSGKSLELWPPGKAFEYMLLRQFELEHVKVVWPYRVQVRDDVIEQIDGAVYVNAVPFLVEAKDEKDPVNFGPIAKLTSVLARRPPTTMGMVFARNGFTENAKILAQYSPPIRILLWESEDINAAFTYGCFTKYLVRKYEKAVEEAMPDFMASEEDES